nr:hypothetical protein [Tanacetum cinerariifolium]
KAFRVFNSRTRIVQETLHINFLENKPNVVGSGPTWLFDIDTLINTMNYQPVTAGNQSNPSAGVQETFDAKKVGEESVQQYVLFLVWSSSSIHPQNTDEDAAFEVKEPEFERRKPQSEVHVSSSSSAQSKNINEDNAVVSPVPAVGQISTNNTNTFSELEDITYSDDEYDVGAEADFNNLETSITVSPIPTTKVHKDHHVTQIIGDKVAKDQGGLSQINNDDFHTYVKSAFLYGTIKEEVYVCQPPVFDDPDYPDKIYVLDIILGSTNKDLCKAFEKLMKDKFQMSLMGELTYFLDGKLASTPTDTEKPLVKDPDGEDMDVHIYRSMIGSLMYLTSSRPDIMFAVNDMTRLQALVDKKKVIIIEATIREALRLDNAESINCLPNEEIFTELSRMGAQVGDLSSHSTKYSSPALTQKVFANMRRVAKGFFGIDMPLFEGMIVAQQDDDVTDEGAASVAVDDVPVVVDEPSIPLPTPTTQPPPPSQDLPSTS